MTSPMLIAIIFIILFSLANNAELTGSIMFLFVSSLIAENLFFERSESKIGGVLQA